MDTNSEYKELVDLVADKELDFDFSNSSVEHAKYVISKIIEKTENNLLIYSRILRHEVFSNPLVLESLKKNKDACKKILLDDNDKDAVSEFKSQIKDNLEIKNLEQSNNNLEIKNLEQSNNIDLPYHFIVSDGKRIRLCSKNEPHQAEVNFNKKKLGEKLIQDFDKLWETGSPM